VNPAALMVAGRGAVTILSVSRKSPMERATRFSSAKNGSAPAATSWATGWTTTTSPAAAIRTSCESLIGRRSFRPGSNFPGWLFRIQRNEFISGLRRERPTVELTDAIAGTLSHAPRQEMGIVLREFTKAFGVSV